MPVWLMPMGYQTDDALIDGVVDTNLVGPYLLLMKARRLIKAEQPGRMVNIASMAET